MDDATSRALACAKALYAHDAASQALGMTIEAAGPGWAKVSMVVRADMTNGMNICHGGYMFSLCDSAFAFACNSYDRRTVAASATIEFLAPGRLGDHLTAEARELRRSGRTGVYDVVLRRADGEVIALFRGRSHEVRGRVLPAPEDDAASSVHDRVGVDRTHDRPARRALGADDLHGQTDELDEPS